MTPRRILRWALPALVVIGVLVAIRQFDVGATVERDGLTFAGPSLSEALDRPGGEHGVRMLSAFTDGGGTVCRSFVGGEVSGIACRERGGWHLRVVRSGVSLDDPEGVARLESVLARSAAQIAAQ